MRNVITLGAGLAAAHLLTGCLPIGCGTADPDDVQSYTLTPAATFTTSGPVAGIAAAPDGVWLLEGNAVVELDQLGGTELRRWPIGANDTPTGLTYDGTALWVGLATGETLWRIDPATGAHTATLPMQAADDLAWNGTDLLLAQGFGAFEEVDPTSGTEVASVPVLKVSDVQSVAFDATDAETWVAGEGAPVLVYDTGGTLIATAQAPLVAASSSDAIHMAFVGDQLVVARGDEIDAYAVDRSLGASVPTPTAR